MAKDAKQASIQREPLVDINAAAARLGVQVRHIRRLVHARRIPYFKWGHLLRFDPAEIDTWLEAARQSADSSTYPSSSVACESRPCSRFLSSARSGWTASILNSSRGGGPGS